MAPRRNTDRAAWETRSRREPLTRSMNRIEQRPSRGDGRVRGYDRSRVESELDRDFAAMKRVWQLIRAGAVRIVGEIGRQY